MSTWPDKQRSVWERDNWRCRYCGKTVVRAIEGRLSHEHDTATLDHVIPRSAGGSNAVGNLVTACFECNQNKGDGVGLSPIPGPRGLPSAPTLGDIWPDLSWEERAFFVGARQ